MQNNDSTGFHPDNLWRNANDEAKGRGVSDAEVVFEDDVRYSSSFFVKEVTGRTKRNAVAGLKGSNTGNCSEPTRKKTKKFEKPQPLENLQQDRK